MWTTWSSLQATGEHVAEQNCMYTSIQTSSVVGVGVVGLWGVVGLELVGTWGVVGLWGVELWGVVGLWGPEMAGCREPEPFHVALLELDT